jgi:hypothetical protein
MIEAAIGVASAWLIYPVRSTAVLRRRIADALALLADSFDSATPERSPDDWLAASLRVREVAHAFRATRWVARPFRGCPSAEWIDALLACADPASALIAHNQTPCEVRKAIGAAGKATRQPEQLLPALRRLQSSLSAAVADALSVP